MKEMKIGVESQKRGGNKTLDERKYRTYSL